MNRARNDDFARLLQDCVAGQIYSSLDEVIRTFLFAFWELVRSQLQIDCREDGVPDTFTRSVEQMLERLVRGLLKNPSRIPKRPRQKKSLLDIDDMLREPLPLA